MLKPAAPTANVRGLALRRVAVVSAPVSAPSPKLAEEVSAYAEAGVDVLIVFPQIPALEQVEQLAEHVLPAYLGSPLPA